MGFPATIGLGSLDGSNGFALKGSYNGGGIGISVSSAGDVNGDGLADIIVGAPIANGFSGASFVVFGSTTAFGAVVNLDMLNGTNGFRLTGSSTFDLSGLSVASAGDVNGDGLDDMIIGAYGANGQAGETYVVFGQSGGFPKSLSLAKLDGTNGFVLAGAEGGDQSGTVVAAGDVNADGLSDMIIGAPGASGGTGATYVVFGQSAGFAASMDLSTLDGSNGFVINGITSGDFSGSWVATADVNGDGIADIVIGAPGANDGAGAVYVVFGSNAGFPAAFDLAGLDGTNGFVINGVAAGDGAGTTVAYAGDVNGDGIADIIIGAADANNGDGACYVVFGAPGSLPAVIDLASLDGSNGFVIPGIASGGLLGGAVGRAGDVNGDGISDIIVGAPFADNTTGTSYVIFGKTGSFPAVFDLTTLDGTNGFSITGVDSDDQSGNAVACAGDVNGDGVDDILIGAPGADCESGMSYVVFGIAGAKKAAADSQH